MKARMVALQFLPPPHFEASWRQFLADLPEDAMTTDNFAKLAYFAGVVGAFEALRQHDQSSTARNMSESQNREALAELALEPLEYLIARGVPLP